MPSSPKTIQLSTPRTAERVWGTETFLVETEHYLGKLLNYKAGTAGGLQYHRHKDEAFYLHSGEAWVDYEGPEPTCCPEWDCGHESGCTEKDLWDSPHPGSKLVRRKMTPGMCFRIPPGATHRFEAITDCVVFEVSTPVYDDRVRVEEDYGVPVIGDEYGLETTDGRNNTSA